MHVQRTRRALATTVLAMAAAWSAARPAVAAPPAEELAFADRLTAAIAARAVCDENGARWPHAENRVSPEDVVAQTGFMQGAAGVGFWLLRHDALHRGLPGPEPLPDSPYR